MGFTRAKIIHPSLTSRSFFVVTLCSLKDETNEAEKYIFLLACEYGDREADDPPILPPPSAMGIWGEKEHLSDGAWLRCGQGRALIFAFPQLDHSDQAGS